MRHDLLLRIGTKLLLPFIMLFALYVQFHGDYGPGGGFQAGVIAAAMVILLTLTIGLGAARRVAPQGLLDVLMPLGVAIYAGTGLLGLLGGQNFLDYSVLDEGPPARELGIFLVEIGVLVTVASTMLVLFFSFVERGR